MLAISWTKRSLGYSTTDSSDQPTYYDIRDANSNAFCLVDRLHVCQRRMRWLYPLHTDAQHVVSLIDQVLQALRDDHGGALPHEVLDCWSKNHSDSTLFATPNEKKAMMETWRRWKDEDRLQKDFWAFRFQVENDDFLYVRPIAEERILQVKQCLLEWLKKRKAGLLY